MGRRLDVIAVGHLNFVRASQIPNEAEVRRCYKGRTDSFLLMNWHLFATVCRKVELCDCISAEFN
jgi:hypothetical protein